MPSGIPARRRCPSPYVRTRPAAAAVRPGYKHDRKPDQYRLDSTTAAEGMLLHALSVTVPCILRTRHVATRRHNWPSWRLDLQGSGALCCPSSPATTSGLQEAATGFRAALSPSPSPSSSGSCNSPNNNGTLVKLPYTWERMVEAPKTGGVGIWEARIGLAERESTAPACTRSRGPLTLFKPITYISCPSTTCWPACCFSLCRQTRRE